MFAVIGIVAVTLVFGLFFLKMLAYSAMCFMGFDECQPVLGVLFLIAAVWVAAFWWFAAGTHINISLSVS